VDFLDYHFWTTIFHKWFLENKTTNHMKATGYTEYNKHLHGSRLTQRQMIRAKCFDCMGAYDDGKADCKVPKCPLYPLMPYRNRSMSAD
jgi:hypothetical protein